MLIIRKGSRDIFQAGRPTPARALEFHWCHRRPNEPAVNLRHTQRLRCCGTRVPA